MYCFWCIDYTEVIIYTTNLNGNRANVVVQNFSNLPDIHINIYDCYLGPESLTAEKSAQLLRSNGPKEVLCSLVDLKEFK